MDAAARRRHLLFTQLDLNWCHVTCFGERLVNDRAKLGSSHRPDRVILPSLPTEPRNIWPLGSREASDGSWRNDTSG